jgi:UrcA family protein
VRSAPSTFQRALRGFVISMSMSPIGLLAAVAHADFAPSSIVRYDTRDLASETGAQRLLSRIESAAHAVCFDQDLAPLPLHQARTRCYLAALAHAVEAVRSYRLTAAYTAKYGTVGTTAREPSTVRRTDGG